MPTPNTHKAWWVKVDHHANIAYTSLRVSSTEDWYFDSGCSRHITGVKTFLVNLKTYTNSYVTFDDSGKGKILGKG